MKNKGKVSKKNIIEKINNIVLPYKFSDFNLKKTELINFLKIIQKLNFKNFNKKITLKKDTFEIRKFNLFFYYKEFKTPINEYKKKMNFLIYLHYSIEPDLSLKDFFEKYKLKNVLDNYYNSFFVENESLKTIIKDIKNYKHFEKKNFEKIFIVEF